MEAYDNPFTPSFGEIPAHLAGRRDLISALERAYASQSRRPELTTILAGARGTGKTTLLSVLAHRAEQSGWVTASATALPGLLNDIEIGTRRKAQHLVDDYSATRITGVNIASVGGITFEPTQAPKSNWRFRMTDLLDDLAQTQTGLLITVDEVDPALDEMIELAAVYQHFVREGRKVSLLMAGLPHNISAIMNDKTVSFLRRAQSFRLGKIPDYEIEDALMKTIREHGRDANSDGIEYAVQAIDGFPFLMQLVGYRAWDVSEERHTIELKDFQQGVRLARRETEDRILEATFQELSEGDLRFLEAMLEDDGPSRTGEIAKRIKRSSSQVAQYRRRLIDAGVIGARGRGVVEFELPFFRDYLQKRL